MSHPYSGEYHEDQSMHDNICLHCHVPVNRPGFCETCAESMKKYWALFNPLATKENDNDE